MTNPNMEFNYIFGPVASRRLGLSLGVDIVPYKTCTLNCLYCECGPTTKLTIRRAEFVPTEKVIEELDTYLKRSPKFDIITFSGSGEPTLNKTIGKIIKHIKDNYSYPICVLTNGTLLYRKDVQQDLLMADIVIPSLDSALDETFQKINRPHPHLSLPKIIEGIAQFRRKFNGKLYLEIFIIPNLNDNEKNITALKEAVKKISPDKVQLNSLDRPGAVSWISAAKTQSLIKIKQQLSSICPVEIISRSAIKKISSNKTTKTPPRSLQGRIINILSRRPSTIVDLSISLKICQSQLKPYVKKLIESGRIKQEIIEDKQFLSLTNRDFQQL